MWIIPRNSRFFLFVPATEVWNSDFPAHWRTLCKSLLWRSKPTPWRTWSQRLKKVSWLSRLCGRTCGPSRRSDFEDALISSLRATRASRSASRASVRAPMTPDTFGRLLLESSRQLSLFGASSRTSPDTLASDSPTFIAAYEQWITKLRLDCLQRQSAAHPTNGNGSLSWPTARAADGESCGGHTTRQDADSLKAAVNWQTPKEARGDYVYPNGDKTNPFPTLSGQVKCWPTPQHSEYKGQSQRGQFSPDDRLTNKVLSGLPAPDSLSTNGKSRELWTTPRAIECRQQNSKDIIQAISRQVGKGKLNPAWVEQLMGLPSGWTDCDSSATASSRSRRIKRSGSCMKPL